MSKQLKIAIVLALIANLVACASEAYYAAQSACEPSAYNRYPAKMVTQLVTTTREVDVPTGTTSCTSSRLGRDVETTCVAVTQKRTQTYQESEAVDINERPRKDMIERCTIAKCRQQFGNDTCTKK
jgi:hypothetical protein